MTTKQVLVVPRSVSSKSQKRGPRETVSKPSGTQIPNTNLPWPVWRSYAILTAATILCLIPFSGKAFQVDDTLFLFAAKQIVKHPFNPYGFQVVWNTTAEPMSQVTKNPPLACYYAALAGWIAGWSERALHFAFLFPTLGLVLGTYRLAQHLTSSPLLAAFATLLTPGVLVSATSVMCDTLMIALWVWATVLWMEGLELRKPMYLLASSVLIAASALTKYFGAALIFLLLAYSLLRLKRIGWWAMYLLVPILVLAGYELLTAQLYGQGLISDAAAYAGSARQSQEGSIVARALTSISFMGGCALSALTLMYLIWQRKLIFIGGALSVLGGISIVSGWVDYGVRVGGSLAYEYTSQHWLLIAIQLSLCILSGLSMLIMAVDDVRRHKNAESWLLALWVMGTWVFAGFLNWTVNARSVVPLIPAVGILIFRRMDTAPACLSDLRTVFVGLGLALTATVSLCVTASDAAWANSAREAASLLYVRTKVEPRPVVFLGHWGFQYYMQELGFTPADEAHSDFQPGDLIVVPSNNVELAELPQQLGVAVEQRIELLTTRLVTTMNGTLGAGFYSSYFGPLPFAFGNVPPELYYTARVGLIEPGARANH